MHAARQRLSVPVPGIEVAAILDDAGKRPWTRVAWPSLDRGLRCFGPSTATTSVSGEQYWSKWDGIYFPGDGAKRDEDGYLWILGRDRRRAERGRTPDRHDGSRKRAWSSTRPWPKPRSWAKSHDVKGQAIAAFVTLMERRRRAARSWPSNSRPTWPAPSAAIARPDAVFFAAALPKTRSGKIMRRLLGDIAGGRALGDTTTLADPAVVDQLKQQYEAT